MGSEQKEAWDEAARGKAENAAVSPVVCVCVCGKAATVKEKWMWNNRERHRRSGVEEGRIAHRARTHNPAYFT